MSKFDSGIHFVVEPTSTELSQKERDQIAEINPSGVMFRKRNFLTGKHYDEWLESYSRLLQDVKSCINRDKIIVAVDHEGGRVHRFPEPVTNFPYPAFWGARTLDVAKAMAKELRSLGINLNFAPVLDIHSNPDNPVINERAFGKTKEKVCELALQFLEAMEEGGVLGCGKHFPGHGDTSTDSHFDLPIINKCRADLMTEELVPFKAAIDAGISAIMSAHLMVPELDKDEISTISNACMNSLLRTDLGFEGVIITDAIGMEAVKGCMLEDKGCTKAVNAGVDLMCMAGDPITLSDSLTMKRDLEMALDNQEIELNVLEASQRRIEQLLHRLPQYTVTTLSGDILAAHHELAEELNKNKPWSNFEFSPSGFE